MTSKPEQPFRDVGASDAGQKTYRLGTHRAIAPAETIRRVRPMMREMGITRIANVTGLDRVGIPVVMVCRPNARSVAVSQGKGLDLDAAKASGLMEAIEIYHAERITLPLKLGGYEDLRHDHRLADLDGLPRVAGRTFDPDLPILWIEGRDLVTDKSTWLPFEVVHANYTLPPPPSSGCFEASTNGLASGNHFLEAVSHGICEVVERDSTSLWNQLGKSGRDRTRVDLATVDDSACRAAVERLECTDLGVAVWHTTTDIGIPSFYCAVTDQRSDGAHPGAGAGCHPTREVAFLRALTEAVQVRMTYIAGSRDDLTHDEYTASAIAEKLRKVGSLLGTSEPALDFRSLQTWNGDTFEDDVRWQLDRLRAVGVEQVIAVDLTKANFQLSVVRIVIPGLEGPDDHEDYVPGARALALQEAS